MDIQLEEKDDKIVRELIRNPRISDNQIARNTGLPVKTVSRHRKRMEKAGLLLYMTKFNHFTRAVESDGAIQFVMVTLRRGLTKQAVYGKMDVIYHLPAFAQKHIRDSYIAERDGQVVLILLMESPKSTDIVEILNADLFPYLDQVFGTYAVHCCQTYPVAGNVSMLHNYVPAVNMQSGTISKDWPDSKIYVR